MRGRAIATYAGMATHLYTIGAIFLDENVGGWCTVKAAIPEPMTTEQAQAKLDEYVAKLRADGIDVLGALYYPTESEDAGEYSLEDDDDESPAT